MKIFLTAPPNTGKSTVIEAVSEYFILKYGANNVNGMIAREILNKGERIGFICVDPSGCSEQFMFQSDVPFENIIGSNYTVSIDVLDNFIVPELKKSLNSNNLLTYIDEIGRAQIKSPAFIDVVREILSSSKNTLASIMYEDISDDGSAIAEFKIHPSVCTLEVTVDNRCKLPKILIAAFENASLFKVLGFTQKKKTYELLRRYINN